jgi:hypothetical protein
LREVFRFELAHILRSRSTWAYAALLFLFPAWISLGTHESDIAYNAPVRMAFATAICAVFGLLVTAGMFGAIAVRDVEAEMHPLLFTSRLNKGDYLFGRYLAALAANALLLLAIPISLLIVTFLPIAAPVGPIRLAAYLQPFILFTLPSLVIASGLLFAIAMFTRQTIPVYLAAIVLFISGIVSANYAGSIGNPLLSGLADPFGMSTFEVLSHQWTHAEQSTRLLGFPAALVLSRLAWILFSAGVLGVLHARFRFAHDDGGRRRRSGRRPIADHPVAERAVSISIPRVEGTFGRFTWWRQTLTVARRCFGEVTNNRMFAFVLVLAFGLTLAWGWNVGSTVFDTTVWPVTHLVAAVALSARNQPIILLLLALWAGELVWKDREVGMSEVGDSAPMSDGVALFGRFIAIVASLVILEATVMAAGITLQALQGYYHFELGVYLKIIFGITLANYILFAALAMTIHVVVNHKYLGHTLMLVAFVLTKAAGTFGIHHHLLIYASDPGWTYSDMNGFGPFLAPLVWFKLYWAAWALLLLVIASVLWVRGREPRFRRQGRLRWPLGGLTRATAGAAAVAVALILGLGGFIFYNTNILNDYTSPETRGSRQAEYEKRYKRFENAVQPTIVALDERVELYPDRRTADIRGTYRLVNRSTAPIDSVHVYTEADVDVDSLAFDRQAAAAVDDAERGYRIFALERAIEPGDSLQLTFVVSWRPHGFPNSDIPTAVVENGTLINRRLLPFIGYQPVLELDNATARRRAGFAPRPARSSPTDSAARNRRQVVRNEDEVRVHAIIGTATDQIAVTSGALRRSWTEKGRRYFEYDTERPESFGATVLSGRYDVLEDSWKDVKLRVLHHPPHMGSVRSAMQGMKASLDYFSEQFGPYRYSDLRLAEYPPYGGYGSAHPSLIAFAERFFIFRVGDDEVDEPFYGAAHETAHSWWGGMVRGASVAGAEFLSESQANYSAMILVEQTFGAEAARRVYDAQMSRYFSGRAQVGREVPVLQVSDQAYISYRKGALAMYMLREQIGIERVNGALRRYAEKYRNSGPPYPTSYDLYAELRAVTPDSLHTMLSDLFETVTLWDVRARGASVRRLPSGDYEVTLDVTGKKVRADSAGNESEVPMNDLVEIGVFGRGKNGRLGEPLYLQAQRIRSGTQTITMTVPSEPSRAGIDPYNKLFDRQRDDNVVAIKAPPQGASHEQ